jgi:excinuclease UvrABC ATPase subunit
VACGTPEEIAQRHDSYTGYYVDKMLRAQKRYD